MPYSSQKHRHNAETVVMTTGTLFVQFLSAVIGACVLSACQCNEPVVTQSASTDNQFEFSRIVMGAPCRVVFYAPSEESANESARAVFERLARIEEALSDWVPSSETRQLPSLAAVQTTVGADLATALSASLGYARMTDGAFDPSIGALTKRWRAARRDGRAPDAAELLTLRARCGWQQMQFDESAHTYAARVPGLELDFGGIGQGIGADAALEVLRERGVTSALIDLSGDIAVSDAPPGRTGWNIDLDDPWHTKLELANAAVTTSGDRFQHMDVAADGGTTTAADGGTTTAADGGTTTRRSHIIDPATGEPLTTRVEVVVVARTGVEADALATALSVMGPERGLALLAKLPSTSARWRYETQRQPVVTSAGWPTPALRVHTMPGIATF
jgi:thiamine biosynthesis lipoprotein